MSTYKFVDCGRPEYLDGCQMQYDVRDQNDDIVAYVKKESDCRLFAGSIELLEALNWIANNPHAHPANMVRVASEAIAKVEWAS